MQWRCNLAHLILASFVVLGLTPLDAQARIAFVSRRDGNLEIYVMDINGGNQRNLTNHPDSDGSPAWSPDGKRIVFRSNRDGHIHLIHGWSTSEIYVMDADGKQSSKTSLTIPMMTGRPHGHRTVNALFSRLIGIGIRVIITLKSTLWTPMERINKDLLKTPMKIGLPHGHWTVNALSSRLGGMGTL